MADLFNILVLGVRLWIWIYFLFGILSVLGAAAYWYRERIIEKFYKVKFPERLIKVVIHYDNTFFREFYRLVPDAKTFSIHKKTYQYDENSLLKNKDFMLLLDAKHDSYTARIEGKDYPIKEIQKIIKKEGRFPEIHFFVNSPIPIEFDIKKKDIYLTAKQIEMFKENDLFVKLLSLKDEQAKLTFIVILLIIVLLGIAIIICKLWGWIK